MWELQYTFPYENQDFRRIYGEMITALSQGRTTDLSAIRRMLKQSLSSDDWDYMTWQEWKEGLARYLENAIRARLGRPANRGGLKPPFTRVTFYAGGESLIDALSKGRPVILKQIETLYHQIAEQRQPGRSHRQGRL